MADDVKVTVDVQTSDSVDRLERVEDASRNAGEAIDKLDRNDPSIGVELTGDRDAVRGLDDVEAAAGRVDQAGPTVKVDTAGAEPSRQALDDVGAAAGRIPDTVRVDLDVDVDKARATADSFDGIDRKSRGATEGLGFQNNALRDLTGPLGDATGNAGDLGDAFEGLGDIASGVALKLGASAETAGRIATTIGAAGVVIAAAAAAWNIYRDSQRKAEEATRDMIEVQKALNDGKFEEAATKLADGWKGSKASLDEFGVSSDDLVRTLMGQGATLDDLRAKWEALGGASEAKFANIEEISRLEDLIGKLEEGQAAYRAAGLEIETTAGLTRELTAALGGTAESALEIGRANLAETLLGIKEAGDKARDQFVLIGDAAVGAADDIREIPGAWDDVIDALDDRGAVYDVKDAFDRVRTAAEDAWNAAAAGEDDAERKARDFLRAQDELRRKVIEYGTSIDGIPKSRVTAILAEVDANDLEEAQRLFDELTKDYTATIKIDADTSGVEDAIDRAIRNGTARSGSTVTSSSRASRGETVGIAAGTTYVYTAPIVSPQEVYRANAAFAAVEGLVTP